MKTAYSHEPSSVYVYDVIEQYGGARSFYSDFYIHSPFPLAIIRHNARTRWLYANYYAVRSPFEDLPPIRVSTLQNPLAIHLDQSNDIVLGKKYVAFTPKTTAHTKH